VLVIGLVWSLVYFTISIKGIYYPGQERTLIQVFFCYVVATVLINRIAGLYGESDKAAFYSILLGIVMALFALTFSARFGSIIGGSNAGEGLLINVAIVAIVGFASYKLSREACFDIKDTDKPKSAIQLRQELRAQKDWYQRMQFEEEEEIKKPDEARKEEEPVAPAKLPKKHPGIWIIYFSIFSMIAFAAGQRLLPADSYELYARTFNCMVSNAVYTLALLLLITLSSLRYHCWQKKARIPDGVGWFWVMTGGVLILIVLSLASLPPRPVPEYIRRTMQEAGTASEIWYDDSEEGEKSKSLSTWGGETKKIEMQLAKEQRDIPKVMGELKDIDDKEKEETEKEKGEADGASDGKTETDDKSSEGGTGSDGDAPGKGGSSGRKRQQKGKGGRTPPASAGVRSAPLPTPPLQGLQTIGKLIIIVVLALGIVWAASMLLVAIGRTNPLTRLRDRLKDMAGRLRGLLKGMKRPLLSGRKLQAALESENLYMENPFSDPSLLRRMSTRELVSYTYKAFENYAHVQGHTPFEGQTPAEFMRSLPDAFRTPEFSVLLKMFMRSEYSSHPVSDKNVKDLKQIWSKIEVI